MVGRTGLGTSWKRVSSVEVFSVNTDWSAISILEFGRNEVSHYLLAVSAILHLQSVDSQVSASTVLFESVVVGLGLLQLELELISPGFFFVQFGKKSCCSSL